MLNQVYVVCAACRSCLALEWDATCFLADDPLGGQDSVPSEIAEPALIYGAWPQEKSAPAPLAAGAWAAMATLASSFVLRHLAHPVSGNIYLSHKLPDNCILIQPRSFVFPKPPPFAKPVDLSALPNLRNLTLTQRLDLAAGIGTKRLWDIVTANQDDFPEGLLLFGWLPANAADNANLLLKTLNENDGHVAEEALATRIVLETGDPVLRRRQLIAVAESAYARRGMLWARVRETPYDDICPIEDLQAGAVERLVAAGRIERACELAVRCTVAESRLGKLRLPLVQRVLDTSSPSDTRVFFISHAQKIFHGLISELRKDHGLACKPLPPVSSWSELQGSERTMACICAAPSAVRAALASADLPTVIEGLEIIRGLASIIPEDTVTFLKEVLILCHDGRTEPPPIRTRLCARARNVHSLIFSALDGSGAWEALIDVMNAMMKAGMGASLGMHFRALSANRIPVGPVGTLLADWVSDRAKPLQERIQAREALSVLASDAGAVCRNQPIPSPEGRAAVGMADNFLISALTNPDEPDEFKNAIRSFLTSWMPERIPELQGKVIERAGVPPITALNPGQSIAVFDKNEVIALLNRKKADPGLVLSAIALTVPFVRMMPSLGPRFESLLRMRMADNRRFSEGAWNRVIASEAGLAHGEIWRLLQPESYPTALDLLMSFHEIAISQDVLSKGEQSHAATLAKTVNGCLHPSDIAQIAEGLAVDIANRKLGVWSRLHSYHAMTMLKGQGGTADNVLFEALADPEEDSKLRAEAHALLSPHLPEQVFNLQARGLLPRPPIPPVETLYHNLPLFERDTQGEWTLTPEAVRLGHLVFPDDLLDALNDSYAQPSRACAAAALAFQVARRLPDHAGHLVVALQNAMNNKVELHMLIEGRECTFCLSKMCAEALHSIGDFT